MKYGVLVILPAIAVFLLVQPLPAGVLPGSGPEAAPPRIIKPVIDIDQLAEAIIHVESDGRARCRGNKGERGLMQIRRATWKWTCRKLLKVNWDFNRSGFDPAKNIAVGKAYLAYLAEQLPSEEAVICAYNCGITNYLNNRVPNFTLGYLRKVQSAQSQIEKKPN